jgi:hypothetical protein
MGIVYIGNTSASFVDYAVNHGALGPSRPAYPGPSPARFTPYFLTATWEKEKGETVFGYGPNDFTVTFRDQIPPVGPHRYRISVPRSVSTSDDLILYVFREIVLGLDSRGHPFGVARELRTAQSQRR